MNKKIGFLMVGAIVLAVIMPLFVFAAPLSKGGLIPCGGPGQDPCTLCYLFLLGQIISDYFMWTIAPIVAVLVFAWGGFKILMSGASPGYRQEGFKIIRNAVYGLLIVFTAWILVNEFLVFFVGGTGIVKIDGAVTPWTEITCPAPIKEAAPPPEAPMLFNNIESPELITFFNCVKTAVPKLRPTSFTDSNIALGVCNPTNSSPPEIFDNPQHCQHAKNSCHYGGTNPTCIARGSYAFDFGTSDPNDPPYTTVEIAVKACNPNAYVQYEGNPPHGHASIGAANSCGCN